MSYNFVSKIGAENLLKYKYFGSDHSLLYKHIYSPMSQFLVDKVIPTWLAPNVITLIGFAATLLPHIILWIAYPESFAGNVPAWMCYMAALGQFLYIIFDNADGKQARKTGSSSPLGLLFDHGCDAVNTFVAGATLLTVVQFGNSLNAMIAYLIVIVPFYMATWEEYYTDHLSLPIINGPNEGITGVISLFILSGVFGNQIWTDKMFGYTVNELALVMFTLMSISNMWINVVAVVKKKKNALLGAMWNLATMFYIVASVLIVSCLSPSNVVSRKARFIMYFFGFGFSKLVGHLQVSHVTQTRFNQFIYSIILPITALNANTIIGYFRGEAIINEDLLITILCAASTLIYAHFAVNIVTQFSKILKIDVFRITKRPAAKTN
jgi:ethanolaminephosphotransferase